MWGWINSFRRGETVQPSPAALASAPLGQIMGDYVEHLFPVVFRNGDWNDHFMHEMWGRLSLLAIFNHGLMKSERNRLDLENVFLGILL